MQFNSRGQVGQTLTWAVATIVVFMMAFLFLWGVSKLNVGQMSFTSLGEPSQGVANQQMLFSFLQKGTGELYEKIENAKTDEDWKEVEGLARANADEFIKLGYDCNFIIYDSSNSYVVIDNTKGEYRIFEKGNFVNIQSKTVVLTC